MFGSNRTSLAKTMPLFARHEGVWEGEFRHFDADGKAVDEHLSVVECRFPRSGNFPYYQINHYSWSDGRTEEVHLPARFKNGLLQWNNDNVEGVAWEIDDQTLVMRWLQKDGKSRGARDYMYEMVHLHPGGRERTRTRLWFRDNALYRRTLVNETRKGA